MNARTLALRTGVTLGTAFFFAIILLGVAAGGRITPWLTAGFGLSLVLSIFVTFIVGEDNHAETVASRSAIANTIGSVIAVLMVVVAIAFWVIRSWIV